MENEDRLALVVPAPHDITVTSLRPHSVLWSTSENTVIMVKFTVPWEEGMEATFKKKKEKYSDLAVDCTEAGKKLATYSVQFGSLNLQFFHLKFITAIPENAMIHWVQAEEIS